MDLISQYRELKNKAQSLINHPEMNDEIINALDDFERQLIENEKKIEEEELYFKFLSENIVDVVWVLDVNDRKFIYLSPSVEHLRGYSANEIMQQPVHESLMPCSLKQVEESLQTRLPRFLENPNDHQIFYDEIEQPCKDGTVVVTETSTFFRINCQNQHIEVVGVSRNITERKKTEQALRESELKYKEVIQNLPAVIYKYSNKKGAIFCSKQVKEIFGYEPEDFIINPFLWRDLIHREDFPLVLKAIRESKDGDIYNNEYRVRVKSGEWKWIHDRFMHKTIIGDEIILEGIATDITERKLTEVALITSEARLKRAELASQSGNWELHLNSQTIYASEGATKIYEVDGNKFDLSLIKEFLLPQYRSLIDSALKNLIDNDLPYDVEYKIKTAKSAVIKDIHSKAIFDREKGILFGIIQDITERKLIEDELIELNQQLKDLNTTKDKLFSIIAHDLKNPFNTILGFSELLLRNLQNYDNDKILIFLNTLNESAKNAFTLLENLLSWAKTQTGQINFKPRKIHLSILIHEIIEVLGPSAKIKNILIEHLSCDGLMILADQDMLKVILQNLVSNAIKFTNPDGRIKILTLDKGDELEISVSDNGIGVSDEIRAKLFRLDTHISTIGTRQEKGSGLGLILCKEFVEKHGGRIWVESEPGNGSTFKFLLPMVKMEVKN